MKIKLDENLRGIRYPGDDGSEPAHVREQKAQEYAAKVVQDAERAALTRHRRPSLWERMMGRQAPTG